MCSIPTAIPLLYLVYRHMSFYVLFTANLSTLATYDEPGLKFGFKNCILRCYQIRLIALCRADEPTKDETALSAG